MHRIDPSWYKPGMVTSRSAIYRVYHYQHRSPHEVFIPADTTLPMCRHCAHLVQYAPLLVAEPLENDHDLASAEGTAA